MAWNFRIGLSLLALLLLGDGAASAAPFPDANHLLPPTAGPRPPPEETPSPYPMNYADEAAQALGFKQGRMDLFATRPEAGNPFMPVLSGGLGKGGAMIRLQWRSAP